MPLKYGQDRASERGFLPMPNLLSPMLTTLSKQVIEGAARPASIGPRDDLASTFASMGIILPPATIAALRSRHRDWVAFERALHESFFALAATRTTAARTAGARQRMRRELAASPRGWLAGVMLLGWAVFGRSCGMFFWWGGLALGAFWIAPDVLLDASYVHAAGVRRVNAWLYRREKRRLFGLRLCTAEAREIYAETLEEIARIHSDSPAVGPAPASHPAAGVSVAA